MILSMTGFGRAEQSLDGWQCGVELRSVNSRFLEIRMKLPHGLGDLEDSLKKEIKARCERGKVDCTVTLTIKGENGSVRLNEKLAGEYAQLLQALKKTLGTEIQVSLGNLAGIKELIMGEGRVEPDKTAEKLVRTTIQAAIGELVNMRKREGEFLQQDLLNRTKIISDLLEEILPLIQDLPKEHALRLKENISKLLDGSQPVNEERLAQEVALMADKCDVSEEITRFQTHLEHLKEIMEEGGAVGRKFEFLLQEINRETNTLSVKSNHTGVSARVVTIKSELEKLREQIQNIE